MKNASARWWILAAVLGGQLAALLILSGVPVMSAILFGLAFKWLLTLIFIVFPDK